jgi:hypothetical protein
MPLTGIKTKNLELCSGSPPLALKGWQKHVKFEELRCMGVTPELLKKFPILKLLPDKSLKILAECSVIRKFSPPRDCSHRGKKEDNLCFLFEGRLQGVDFTIDGREVGLYFVEPGGFCGELTLFDNEVQ